MPKDGGFALAWRSRWEHPIFRNLHEAAIWAWLTDMAVWRDTTTIFCDRVVPLKRGQIITSERFISTGFCCGRRVVRTVLERLESAHMIARQPTHGGTVITICNYNDYQDLDTAYVPPKDPPPTHARPMPDPNKKTLKTLKQESISFGEDANFTEWYEVFPRKADRPKAAKAYAAAIKRGATRDDLLDGAQAYAKEREGQDPKFTKMPATWLNADSWQNEPDLLQTRTGGPFGGACDGAML